MSHKPLILASLSPFRKSILENAGLEFDVEGAKIDERELEKTLGKITPQELAKKLAMKKAEDVSSRFPDALVIGCDQTLELEGNALHKVANLEGVRDRLFSLSSKTHYLHSGIALAKAGKADWVGLSTTKMTVRSLSPEFIDYYIDKAGEDVQSSVGAYQVEGLGIQLFDKIDGDYFTIIGLPLLLLLQKLRETGIIIR
ncbi:Maf family nucleotide pyrophosphatase [Bartonella apis]|uniref:Maf family nucleotide pyrophosphatase n=1 Tax=Bartonella apis TaxID=1686310 RepID=UPI0009611196|nr:Maf family nucleotide pyrophosphatase [Bartonella apis]OLY48649.1 septum formation protein [Bartonella apis]